LENISIAYRPGEFIADQLIPAVSVQHESDKYYVYDNDTMSMPETLRANGSRSNRAQFNVSTSSYTVEEHALNDVVTMRDRNNADKAMNPEIDVTEVLTKKILIRKEYECAQMCQLPANWSNNYSLTSTYAWTANTTLSNPITQIDSATTKILGSSGYRPNVLAIDHLTFVGAKEHVSITDRVKYTSADSVTEPMLAKLFNVSKLLVASAIYEGADEGLTSAMTWIWTSCAFLAYMEPSAGLRKASAAYNIQVLNGTSPYKVTKWEAPELGEGTVQIEVSSMFKYKPIATACAYLISKTAQ
jgi:hypothetical protein